MSGQYLFGVIVCACVCGVCVRRVLRIRAISKSLDDDGDDVFAPSSLFTQLSRGAVLKMPITYPHALSRMMSP